MKILASICWNGRLVRGFFQGVPLANGRWGVLYDDLMNAFAEKFGYRIPEGSTYSIGV